MASSLNDGALFHAFYIQISITLKYNRLDMKKEITATLLFLIKDGQILLAMKKRGFGVGRFNGVGGKPEPGESIEQTLVRETEEEIGVTPTKFDKVAELTFDEFFKDEPSIMHVHVFTSSKWTGDPAESEEMTPKWFAKNQIPYDIMWPDDPYWLPQVVKGKKLSANFKLDKDDMIISHGIRVVKKL
jgi:8-oxo-dGTP pyrophosphatase MutT (NUDIX family)